MTLAHTAEGSLYLKEKYEAIVRKFLKLTEKIFEGMFLIGNLLVYILLFNCEENNIAVQNIFFSLRTVGI